MKRPSANWLQIAQKKLTGKLGPCHGCGGRNLAFESIVKAALVVEGASSGDGTAAAYLLRLVCSDCACVRFYDAEKLGAIVNA
jgi:hypothetical protein